MRNPDCTLCKLHQTADVVCQWGSGSTKAKLVVVSKMPNSAEWQNELTQDLAEVGIDTSQVYFTQAIRCRTFEQSASNPDVKACRPYLEEELTSINPDWVLALGNEALLSTTGHSGIMKYRGKFYDQGKYQVLPTISPSSVKRNPGQRGGYLADLRLLSNKMKGRTSGIAKPKYVVVDTREKLAQLKKVLESTQELNWDVETHSDYFKADGRIVSLSGTCEVKTKSGELKVWVFALPLYHPESPWKSSHRSVLKYLKSALEEIPKSVAHNGGYDSKWLLSYGINRKVTFDTMLAIHVLNENVQKGLKPQAQARLGVEPWGIDTKDLLTTSIAEVLEYNVLDTWYMYWVKKQLVEELKEKPRLARLLMKLVMPAQRDLVDSEMRGIWIDVPRLEKTEPLVKDTLQGVHNRILAAADIATDENPLGLRPEDSAWPKDAKGKPREINLNASIFARWMLFDWCGLPIYERGKEKANGAPGDPSMAEDVLLALKPIHPVVSAMLDRVTWQKYLSSFIIPYGELYDEEHRIHTNFKLAGTVTGRLSSGKNDADKVTGSRGKIRGVNLQQVPRDPLIRGLFGAPPGWTFVEADYSQVELRIAAFLARERHMLHLYSIGADIHLTTAARVTGLPESQVPKEVRKKVGKPVNFGFLYGMGWRKFIETAFNNYGAEFSEEEAKGARRTFFDLYPGLPAWHNRQRRLVNEHGRVQSPIGRVRHLPDIFSPEQGVRAEAERQAINCVTTDTEILTTQGWKTVDNLRIGDLILSPNASTRELEIQPLTKLNRGFYTGQAWQIDHNSISAITTPNHRWLVDHRSNGKYTTKFVTPGDFNNHGNKKIWVATEGLRQNNTTWSNDEVELMGWVLTDGHYKKQKGVVKRRLGVTQSKPRYLEEIKQLFNRLGKHSYRIRPTGQHVWEITSDQSARLIDAMPDKTLTPEVLMSLSHEQRELLFLTMCKGDGGWTDHRGGRFRRFHCGSEERANIFLMLCALIGQPARSFTRDHRGKDHYSPKLSNKGHVIPGTLTWHVELTKNKRAQPQHGSKWVDVENLDVWCPTVQNGAWVAKRNNKVFITGNSPVQGFASDLAVLSMVAINQKFRELGINGYCLGLVHDAINFEIRNDDVPRALPIIKDTMEDMSLVRKKFGVHVDIPIIADLKTGSHWGDTNELSVDQVYDWKPEYSGN